MRFDHLGKGQVDCIAFDMPARQARQLEMVMSVGGFGHLAQAKIETLCKDHVQQADPVPAGRAGAQMREGVGKSRRPVHIQKKIRDPHLGQAPVKIEHKIIGPVPAHLI